MTSFTSQNRSWQNASEEGSDYFRVACTGHSPGLIVIPMIAPCASRSMCRRSSRGPGNFEFVRRHGGQQSRVAHGQVIA